MSFGLRPCILQGWASCDGNCGDCVINATATTDGFWYHGNGKIGGEFHPNKPDDEERYGERMKIDDRYSTSILADEKTYVDDADYRDYIAKCIQNNLAEALITALCTKDAIVAIKGNSTTRKDELCSGIICRQDICVKDLIFCKDCKYYEWIVRSNDFGQCEYDHCQIVREPDDFCSRGERKDEVENG